MPALPHYTEITADVADSWSDALHYLKYTDVSPNSQKQRIKHMTSPVLIPIATFKRNPRLETSIKMKEKGNSSPPPPL